MKYKFNLICMLIILAGFSISCTKRPAWPGDPQPPTVLTRNADQITCKSARLNGAVNTNGFRTLAFFVYGPSVAYGDTTDLILVSAGDEQIEVSSIISNLVPDQTYHYTLVAFSDINVVNALPETFATFENIAPDPVVDLRFEDITDTEVTLAWTAPGDDGSSGTPSRYDVRYSDLSPDSYNMKDDWWRNALRASSGSLTPQPAGSTERLVVKYLNPNYNYYFALKTADEVPNWSSISNILSE